MALKKHASSLANVEKILDTLEQGIAVFDKDERLVYINPAMRSVTGGRNGAGWSLKDLAQKHQLRTETGDVLEPENFPIMEAFHGKETHEKIFEYVSPADEHIWLSVSCKRILDEDGNLQYVFTTIHNVTNRKSRTDKLNFLIESMKILSLTDDLYERLQQKARLAVPSLADWCAIDFINAEGAIERAVVVHRDSSMIEFVREFEKKFPADPNSPTSPQAVIRTGQAQFVPLITDEMITAARLPAEQEDGLRKLQLKSLMVVPIISKGKSLGCMTLAYAESGRVYTEGDLLFFREFCDHVGVLLDNARLYNEITQRDRAKDIFLASLSHELRNPLAPIKTSLELLRLRGMPEEYSEDIATIEHQFDHMTHLLGDLLDVTRYTQAKIPLAKTRVDLKVLLQQAIRSSEPLIRGAALTLEYSHPEDSVFIEADETRIEQAMLNLISNALKFTPAGGLLAVELDKREDSVVITVRDNGVGITANNLPHVFEMYFQDARASKDANPGLGLGLYLVKQIVELHGGSVVAKSEGAGHGSEFTISLPIGTDMLEESTGKAASKNPKGLRVLVVDDNIPAADSMVRLLNVLGAQAEAAYSGGEALVRRDIDTFDFVVLDVGMPEITGYDVVRTLRERGFKKPIVALTGYGFGEDKDKALREGFNAHLTKPVGSDELRSVFENLNLVA